MNFETNSEGSSNENYLTDSQKRSLTSSLFLFGKALHKASQLLSEEDEVRIFYSRKTQLSSKKRLLIQKKISQTLKDLACFAKKMELSSTEESIESEIMADMSISWENIEECRSNRLKGYGRLNPNAVRIIDSAINYFAQRAIEISGLVTINSQDDVNEDTQ
jgi:5'-3' exonuclease